MRKSVLAARRAISAQQRDQASAIICANIIRSREFISCTKLACYLPTHDEVDPTTIIERAWCANKRVYAPVSDTHGTMNFRELTPDTEITRNAFGLWEPVMGSLIMARSLDIVLTPLVAFDDNNNRIGMGGGYFDRCFRFLRNRRKWLRPKLIGLAFDCQRVTEIVPDSWDVQLYKIVTETKT